jgi:hypothetical protein
MGNLSRESENQAANFEELPVDSPRDKRVNGVAIGCVAMAAVLSFWFVKSVGQTFLAILDEFPAREYVSKTVLSLSIGASLVQLFILSMALKALIQRRGAHAIQWAIGLFAMVIFSFAVLIYVQMLEASP